MRTARVAEVVPGSGAFSAYVDLDAPEPFAFVQGPDWASQEQAVAWARTRAERVIVRVGERFYSAGTDPAAALTAWAPPEPSVEPSPSAWPTLAERWWVEGGMGWFRHDTQDVIEAFCAALSTRADPSTVSCWRTESGFHAEFALAGGEITRASEEACRIARESWTASGITAEPGTDFDAVSVSVRAPRAVRPDDPF